MQFPGLGTKKVLHPISSVGRGDFSIPPGNSWTPAGWPTVQINSDTVTEQDPMGPSWTDPLPQVLCLPLLCRKAVVSQASRESQKPGPRINDWKDSIVTKVVVGPGELVTIETVNQPHGSHSIYSSSLKYIDNSIWYTFLSCFTDAKTPTK